jgi:hypothetical protein
MLPIPFGALTRESCGHAPLSNGSFFETFPTCNAQERAASGSQLLICFNKQGHRCGVCAQHKLETDSMKQNIKNPLVTGQAATVQPGRADSDFDAAKYTPAPLQSRPLPNEQWAQPAVGNPNVGIQAINDNVRATSIVNSTQRSGREIL